MINSLDIFSIVNNFQIYFEKDKEVNFKRICQISNYQYQPSFIKSKCLLVLRHINSNFFSIDDFKLYIFCYYMTHDKFSWGDITQKSLSKVKDLFDENNIKKDIKLLKKIYEIEKFKDVNDFFKINSDRQNLLIALVQQGLISQLFYIRKWRIAPQTKYKTSKKLEKINQYIKKEIKNAKY